MDEELLDNLHAQVSVLEKEIKYIQSESIQLELILRQKDEEILQERANHSKLLQEKDRYMGAIRDEKKEIAEVRVATELEQHNSNELLLTRQKLLEEKSAKEFDYRESIEVCDNEVSCFLIPNAGFVSMHVLHTLLASASRDGEGTERCWSRGILQRQQGSRGTGKRLSAEEGR